MKEEKEKIPLKTQLSEQGVKLIGFVSTYRVTIMILLFGLVVGFSLYRSSTYSDIPRNEAKFEELNAQTKVIRIDTALIERIQASVDEESPQIGQSTAPGRTNPFSE